MLARLLRPEIGAGPTNKIKQTEEQSMRRIPTIILLATSLLAGIAMAADPVVGSWNLDVAKSKFSPGPAPQSATRVYSESADGMSLDGKTVASDGKESSMHVAYKADGKSHPTTGHPDADSVTAKSVDANTWDFMLTKDAKEVGTVHRVVSADGKTLTVHNKGMHNGAPYDDTLVYTRQ